MATPGKIRLRERDQLWLYMPKDLDSGLQLFFATYTGIIISILI